MIYIGDVYQANRELKFDEHVKNILTICNQRSYLLKCLKGHGLPFKELHAVFCALIVSHILYTLPAWDGFLTADLKFSDMTEKQSFKLNKNLVKNAQTTDAKHWRGQQHIRVHK